MTLQDAVAELQRQIRCPHQHAPGVGEFIKCQDCGLVWQASADWTRDRPGSYVDELCQRVERIAELAKESR